METVRFTDWQLRFSAPIVSLAEVVWAFDPQERHWMEWKWQERTKKLELETSYFSSCDFEVQRLIQKLELNTFLIFLVKALYLMLRNHQVG